MKNTSRPDVASQLCLRQHYRAMVARNIPLPPLADVGYRVYSQTDEDGILLFLFSVIEPKYKLFVEIGCETAMECNCANLAFEFGWHGLFVDGNRAALETGRENYARHPSTFAYPPKFVSANVTRENINPLLVDAGFTGGIDLLSIDIDGMDYWIWDAITVVDPAVVVIEVNAKLGERSITVPYNPTFDRRLEVPHYHGASLIAMTRLAEAKGYRLVGTNRYDFNAFYVKKGLAEDLIPTVDIESCRQHPFCGDGDEFFDTISHLKFVEI